MSSSPYPQIIMLLPHFSQRGAKFSIIQQHLTPQGPKGLGPGPHATLVFSSPLVAALLCKRPLRVWFPALPHFPPLSICSCWWRANIIKLTVLEWWLVMHTITSKTLGLHNKQGEKCGFPLFECCFKIIFFQANCLMFPPTSSPTTNKVKSGEFLSLDTVLRSSFSKPLA